MEHSSIDHAATARVAWSNETGEETGQVKDLVCSRGPARFLTSNSTGTDKVCIPLISLRKICRFLLISRAKPGIDTSICDAAHDKVMIRYPIVLSSFNANSVLSMQG